MKFKTILLASATAMVAVSAAHANPYEGLYGAIGAGANYVADSRDFEVEVGSPQAFAEGDLDYDVGVGITTALGYAFGNGFRTEGEFSYRTNDVSDLDSNDPSFSGFDQGQITGDLKTYALMGNVLYDFHQADKFGMPVTPYVGGGLGIAIINTDIDGNNPTGINSATTLDFDSTRTALAYQGIAGAAFDITENVILDLSYRYFGTRKGGSDAIIGGIPTSVRSTPNSHSVLAALRFNFGAPAAIAAAAAPAIVYKDCWDGSSVPRTSSCPPEIREDQPAVADPIQVTVYFDYDKSNLTSEASSLIDAAVERSRQFDVNGVRVVGNTDRSGSSAYNQALSERRARVVRDALVARGIPAGIISSQSLGESNPAKSTADGVREPLNRRTDITILFE